MAWVIFFLVWSSREKNEGVVTPPLGKTRTNMICKTKTKTKKNQSFHFSIGLHNQIFTIKYSKKEIFLKIIFIVNETN